MDTLALRFGASFLEQDSISALAQSAGFRRAAEQAGITVEALDIEQPLCIDAVSLRRWRGKKGMQSISVDRDLAQRLMVEVLIGHRG